MQCDASSKKLMWGSKYIYSLSATKPVDYLTDFKIGEEYF
jgi:hypothetical protein